MKTSRTICGIAAALLAGGGVPEQAHAAASASPSPCSVTGTYGTDVLVASSATPATVTTIGGSTTETVSLHFKLEMTGFQAGFSMDSYSGYSGSQPAKPSISLSFDGGAWQSPTIYFDRSGLHGGTNGYPWAVSASPVPDVAAGSTHTLSVHIGFASGMTSGPYHTWFFFSGGLPCNGSTSDGKTQAQATLEYAPAAPATAKNSAAATTTTKAASGSSASPSPTPATPSASTSSSPSTTDSSTFGAGSSGQPSESASPVSSPRLAATASTSSGSSLTWLAAAALVLLLAASGAGAFIVRHRKAAATAPGDDDRCG
jgi:hypothetical protein